ncbi:DUF1499 domain-containing protein [Clostridium sp. DL1XJH146]
MKQKKNRGGRGKMYYVLYIVLAVVLVLVLNLAIGNMKAPSNLGVNDGKLAPLPNKPNAVSSQTDKKEFYVEPFPFKESLEVSKEAIIKAVNNFGDGEIVVNDTGYIRVMFTTPKMKYHDDVEFYFDDEAKVIHFRSASRVGYSDMGLNKERYDKLYDYYIKDVK